MQKNKNYMFWVLIIASILLCCKCFQTAVVSHNASNVIGGEVFCVSPPIMVDRQKTDSNGEDEPQIETTTETATANAERASGVDKPLVERKRTYTLTAYCGCEKCCGKSDGITASGVKAVEGVTVATDKSISFGTKIVIDGKTYTVQDRGGAIKGNRIDIYFDSHEKALQYGRQTKEVTILKGE